MPTTTESPSSVLIPPSSPLTPCDPLIDDCFPPANPLDLALDDEGLTALEKIYLFSRSKSTFHRIFIAHAIPAFLDQVTPPEAIEYVLPLLSGLAMDQDESVKEALAAELIQIIWWFFTHCQLTSSDDTQCTQSPPSIFVSVQAFTPILGTLLLSPNALVGAAARYAVVNLLARIRRADIREGILATPYFAPQEPEREMDEIERQREDWDARVGVGLFGRAERSLFQREVLHQVVIGMGRLDDEKFENVFVGEYWHDSDPDADGDWDNDMDLGSTHLPSSPEPSNQVYTLPDNDQLDVDDQGGHDTEQAAVGRLSSMSLMAAVTASGSLTEDTQRSFVTEVERVSHDPVYFVRREAAFALGALAKVVPHEIVLSSLLPLFESLRDDPVWHVRHSALFALPAILARLPPKQRRTLALDSIVALASDESPVVRAGVLEALGEVVYAFYHDQDGPPLELVRLFLGRGASRRPGGRNGDEVGDARIREESLRSMFLQGATSCANPGFSSTIRPLSLLPQKDDSTMAEFYNDPARTLVCAFNYPAVALTLGRARWGELRAVYLELAASHDPRVRRTLAASLGELARIVGPQNARMDLVSVWWDAVRCEQGEVRMRAVGCVEMFVAALRVDDENEEEEDSVKVLEGLLMVWEERVFRGWRERESIAKAVAGLAELVGRQRPAVVRGLLRVALQDCVAAVREAAVSAVSHVWTLFADRIDVLDDLRSDLHSLANSSSYRQRMTFVACQYALVVPGEDERSVTVDDDLFWRAIIPLADDNIIDVRIGVARLIGVMWDARLQKSQPVTGVLLDLIRHLSLDPAQEVRSYVPALMEQGQGLAVWSSYHGKYTASYMVSRPPPLSPRENSGHASGTTQVVLPDANPFIGDGSA